ncbi:MAG: DUF333 domain-containing protein [Asticcacaulis sp.]
MRTLILAALVPLAACTTPQAPKVIGMPNPASKYCVDQGGRSEIRKSAEGDTGYCHLPDGRVIEEWELFRSQNVG